MSYYSNKVKKASDGITKREYRYLHRTIKKESNEYNNLSQKMKYMQKQIDYYKEYSHNACNSYNNLISSMYY